MRVSEKRHMRIFFFLCFALLAVLFYFVLKPFFVALITGLVIAYIFYPLYSYSQKKLRNKHLSSLLVTVFLIFFVSVPLLLIVNNSAQEAKKIYVSTTELLSMENGFGEACIGEKNIVCAFIDKIRDWLSIPQVKELVEESITKMTEFIIGHASNLIVSIPRMVLLLFITFFTTFYAFKDGDRLKKEIERLLPLKKKIRDELFEKTTAIIHGVVYGTIIISVIQGTLGAIAFYFLGISAPIIWGLIMIFLALVPLVGTPIVWAPAAILLFLDGYTNANPILMYKGIGLFLFGALVISTIDNILKPKLISDKASVHPVLILVGVLGGLAAFGIMGFLLGPLIVALFVSFIEIYQKEKRELVG